MGSSVADHQRGHVRGRAPVDPAAELRLRRCSASRPLTAEPGRHRQAHQSADDRDALAVNMSATGESGRRAYNPDSDACRTRPAKDEEAASKAKLPPTTASQFPVTVVTCPQSGPCLFSW